MKNYVIEFIGTFMLVLTIGLSGGNPLAIGAVLAAMVYMGGYVSGAHYNPAVTLSLLWLKKIKSDEAGKYILVQVFAGLLAAIFFQIIHGGNMIVSPSADVGFIPALIAELIFTFALVTTVLHVAVSNKTKNNQYYGLAIGFIVLAGVAAVGAISGGVFNPAVGIGPNLLTWSSVAAPFSNILLYIIGPVAGGMLAAYVYRTTQEG